jgi:hypothetical protein
VSDAALMVIVLGVLVLAKAIESGATTQRSGCEGVTAC